jgi:hypothetical protein
VIKSRLLLISVAACGLLTISGCASNGYTQGGLPETPFNTSSTTIDERALYVAEAAYDGITQIIQTAVRSDLLKGEKAAQVRVLNRQAYDALLLAREAQRTANARTYAEQTARVLGLIAQIQMTIRSQE